ncbi:MAG: Xaa-Pro peptidase family protein [Actinomycetota bacterium]|nr:Xaa-Pro peptidase family protein [Actinomycetota bacterium]
MPVWRAENEQEPPDARRLHTEVSAAAVRRRRLDAVRAGMVDAGVDVLLLSHGADLPWLTGYRAMPLERLTMLVLPVDGDAVLVVPGLEAPRVPDLAGAVELRPWGDTEDPVALVGALVGAAAVRPAPSGVLSRPVHLGISERAWAATVVALQAQLPGATWDVASVVTGPLRAVKDESEVAALRAAGAAADTVASALQGGEIPLVGRSERDVSADIAQRLLDAGHQQVNFAIVGSGPNGASPHHQAGSRTVGPGEIVVCDFGGTLALDGEVVGYCSDITRTVAVGEPSPEVLEAYEVLERAQAAAVAAVRPGVRAEEVDAVARGVIAEAGLGDRFIHRTGHGIGVEEHEAPYLVAGDRTVLAAGHTFSVEPGIYVPGRFGMRLEDIVVVTERGVELLNTAPRHLAVLDA